LGMCSKTRSRGFHRKDWNKPESQASERKTNTEGKMKSTWSHYVAITLFLIVSAASALAQTAAVEFPPAGGMVTLYAQDAQLATLSLLDGKSGMVVRDNVVYNRDSHLAFNIYTKDSIRVGIQGGQRGSIVDLGSADELQSRYGYGETVGKSQGFASIHREAGKFLVLKDYQTREFQPLVEGALLTRDVAGAEFAPVVVGHIYLIRIVEKEAEVVCAKARVLSFTQGQSVTIRWERL
jgi:hypothetical protein